MGSKTKWWEEAVALLVAAFMMAGAGLALVATFLLVIGSFGLIYMGIAALAILAVNTLAGPVVSLSWATAGAGGFLIWLVRTAFRRSS